MGFVIQQGYYSTAQIENATVYVVKKSSRFCSDYGKDAAISAKAASDCYKKQNEIMFEKALVWRGGMWYTDM